LLHVAAGYRSIGIGLLVAIVVALTACGSAEQPVLEEFFGASRLRDTTALQAIATVVFEPAQQGIVRSFRILSVAPERPNRDTSSKDVTIDAAVVLPDGRAVQKNLVVTMERATGDERAGRWRITGVRDGGTTVASP
jgi:hypothetical protein